MKKITYATMALTTMFAISCSNEDITIETGKEFTLTVQPSSVVENIEEFNEGDIYNFGNTELRVRSLIYNEEGELVNYQIGYYDTYQTNVKFMPRLPQGTYTVLTTTDFVYKRVPGETQKYELQYWALKDSMRMQDVYLEDCGYTGGDSKILGTDVSTITVGENGGSATVRPKMNGSLILVWFQNIHTQFSGKELYNVSLSTMESANSVSFSGAGFMNNFDTSNTYDWYLTVVKPSDYTGVGVYSYCFQLATDRCHLAFCAVTQSSSGGYGTQYKYLCYDENDIQQSVFSLTKGEEYFAIWDLEDIANPIFIEMDLNASAKKHSIDGLQMAVKADTKNQKDPFTTKQTYRPFK